MAKVNVYGELNCAEVDGKLARTDQIYDYAKGKYQSEINDSVSAATQGEIQEAIQQLETTLDDLQEAEASAVSDAQAAIGESKEDALEEIAQAIENLEVHYTIETDKGEVKDVQLKDGQGNKLMPITNYDYDVSAMNPTAGPNNDGKFESLSALLSDNNLDTLIPNSVRKGGMSIKYVQISDNKYVQYRYMLADVRTAAIFTNVANWQGVDDEPTAGSDNLVKSRGVADTLMKIGTIEKTKVSSLDIRSTSEVFVSDYRYATYYYRVLSGYTYYISVITYKQTTQLRLAFSDNVPKSNGEYTYIQAIQTDSLSFTPERDGYLCYAIYATDGHDVTCTEFIRDEKKNGLTAMGTKSNNQFPYNTGNVQQSLDKIYSLVYDKDQENYISVDSTLKAYVYNLNGAIVSSNNRILTLVDFEWEEGDIISFKGNKDCYAAVIATNKKLDSIKNGVNIGTDITYGKYKQEDTYVVEAGRKSILLQCYNSKGNDISVNDIDDMFGSFSIIKGKSIMREIDRIKASLNEHPDEYEVSEMINNAFLKARVEQHILQSTDWLQGAIWGEGEESSADSTRIRTRDYYDIRDNVILYIAVESGFSVRAAFYDKNKAFISLTDYSLSRMLSIPTNAAFVRLVAARITWTDISPSEAPETTLYTDANTHPVIADNKDVESARINISLSGGNSAGYLSFAHVSDMHGDKSLMGMLDLVDLLNNDDSLAFAIHTGDIVQSTWGDSSNYYSYNEARSSKPILQVVGNHDVGNWNVVTTTGTEEMCYARYLSPFISRWDVESESGKCYYYKDFATHKIRLIVLFDFEMPLLFDETYWESITYNSSLSNIASSHSYAVGDEVNVDGWSSSSTCSFRCKQPLTTPSTLKTTDRNAKLPIYAGIRTYTYYSAEQIQWLIDTLLDASSKEYAVIIANHVPFGGVENEDVSFMAFNSKSRTWGDASTIADSPNIYVGGVHPILDIINAYQRRTHLQKTYNTTMGLTTQVDADFSSVGFSEFICQVNGHTHLDNIGFNTNYPNQVVLNIDCDNTHYTGSDMRKVKMTKNGNVINLYGIDTSRKEIRVVRIGANINRDMIDRKCTVIKYKTYEDIVNG